MGLHRCIAVFMVLCMATCAFSQADGEVAFAAPPAAEQAAALAADNPLTCATPCYAVTSRYPFKQCGPECDPAVCNRGYGVFQSQDVCCQVSFPDGGCTQRPEQCWVVESFTTRTCVRDDRKCLQGYGVYPSEAACCAPQGPGPLMAAPGAFPQGCANVTKAETPCWVVDTYWPSRQCRQSRTLCGADSGVKVFNDSASCCAPVTGAFSEGCSNSTPPVPCWVVDSYYPNRTCKRSSDVAVCNRGWGVFASQEVCCAPGASFAEGCSVMVPTTPPMAAAVPAPANVSELGRRAGPTGLVSGPVTPLTTPTTVVPVTTAPLPAAAATTPSG